MKRKAIGVFNGNWKNRWREGGLDLAPPITLTLREELIISLDVAEGMCRQVGYPKIQAIGEKRKREILEKLQLMETTNPSAQGDKS